MPEPEAGQCQGERTAHNDNLGYNLGGKRDTDGHGVKDE